MRISLIITACCTAIVGALPSSKTDNAILSRHVHYKDSETLNFVLSLEHFVDTFYRQGIANFTKDQFAESGLNADFYSNLTDISSQESTYVTTLTSDIHALKATPVAECSYNYNVTSVELFLITASLLEDVSVSFYTGLLEYLKDSKYLTVLASILAVHARHSAFIRAARGLSPFPSPFNTPTDLAETNTLVELYTLSCPQNRPIPLKNYATLSSSYSNKGFIGSEITLITYGKDIKADSDSTPLYAAFLTLTGPVFAPTTRLPDNGGFNTTVPASPAGYAPISGFTYVLLSSSKTDLTEENIVAGPATLEIGPKPPI